MARCPAFQVILPLHQTTSRWEFTPSPRLSMPPLTSDEAADSQLVRNPTCNRVSTSLTYPSVRQEPMPPAPQPQGERGEFVCPLSQVREGTSVRIKQLAASPDLCRRLREMGFCEESRIKLLLRSHSVVCQVCNVRLGLSGELADSIWVEPLAAVPKPKPANPTTSEKKAA